MAETKAKKGGSAEQELVESFGTRLREAREKLGLKVAQLAQLVDVTEGAIRQMESGQTKSASFPIGLRLAHVLDISPWDLAGIRPTLTRSERNQLLHGGSFSRLTNVHLADEDSLDDADISFSRPSTAGSFEALIAAVRKELADQSEETAASLADLDRKIEALRNERALTRSRKP